MLITPHQIRAGRALLDWSAEELSDKVGLTRAGISRIETGKTQGSASVINKIAYAMQVGGVEFTNDGGVRPRQSKVVVYQDRAGFLSFFDDIYEEAKNNENPDICITSVNEGEYDRWLGDYEPVHAARMTKLGRARFRVLMKTGDTHLTSTDYCTYKWVPEEHFADVSFYIYANKVAFIEFFDHTVIVTVVDSQSVTDAQRKMFELMWKNALTDPVRQDSK